MSRSILLALSLSFAVGCASHEGDPKPKGADPKGNASTPTPEPEPEPAKVLARASIASVQMIQDCPEEDPQAPAGSQTQAMQAPAAEAMPPSPGAVNPAMRARRAAGDSAEGFAPFRQPCTQSSMQIVFSGQGDEPGKVKIREVRVLDPATSKSVGTVVPRLPSIWSDTGGYLPWDEVVPANGDVKASYRISVPDWYELEKQLGGNSYGRMFVLEVDVEIDGEKQTTRSAEFPREQPHVIVT